MIPDKKISKWGRPWLWLPSRMAHDLSPYTLPVLSRFSPCHNNQWNSFQWRNLEFNNPMGIAGGLDKTGQCLPSWQRLGAGFLEVGTVTPEPQGPNPGKIMDRDIPSEALWNKMGFPNEGVDRLLQSLESFQDRKVPLFVNVAKNRWTENDEAHKDYITCIKKTHKYADAFVINLSSPNTKGLRDLLSESFLKSFLEKVVGEAKSVSGDKPFLLKLSPDMEMDSLKMTLDHSFNNVDGWILTNTTKQRRPNTPFPKEAGGVSGRPLTEISRSALKGALDHLGSNKGDKLVVSAGGIGDEQEILTRLKMGADLVQFYAALVYRGPFFFKQALQHFSDTKV